MKPTFLSCISVRAIQYFLSLNATILLTDVCIFKQNQQFLNNGKCLIFLLTIWRPAAFGDFRKKRLNAHGFVREYLRSCLGYRPSRSVKRRGKSSCLHSKKYFLLGGCGFFVSDIISGGLLGHLGPLRLALGANR